MHRTRRKAGVGSYRAQMSIGVVKIQTAVDS
jgi:hypothetical protein